MKIRLGTHQSFTPEGEFPGTHLGKVGGGWDWPHLRLGEAELRGQLGPLGQRQVLRVLETLVQVLQPGLSRWSSASGASWSRPVGAAPEAPGTAAASPSLRGGAETGVCTDRGARTRRLIATASRLHSGHE